MRIAVALLCAAPFLSQATSADANPHWHPVTEVGLTYSPSDEPLDQPCHWSYIGVLGATRSLGASNRLGLVGTGWVNSKWYSLGTGIRWEHALGRSLRVTATPGVSWHFERVTHASDPLPDAFGEIGISYKGYVTIATRIEGVRTRRGVLVDVDDYGPRDDTDSHSHFDVRFGRLPGAAAMGAVLFGFLVADAARHH